MIAVSKSNVNNRINFLISLLIVFDISVAILFVISFRIRSLISFRITVFISEVELFLDLIFKHELKGEQMTGTIGVLQMILAPVLKESYRDRELGRIVINTDLLYRHDRLVDTAFALKAADARLEVGNHQESDARRSHPDKVLPPKHIIGLLA